MPSYFLAETIKYLYLIFAGDDHWLHRRPYILTTEGHVFPITTQTLAAGKTAAAAAVVAAAAAVAAAAGRSVDASDVVEEAELLAKLTGLEDEIKRLGAERKRPDPDPTRLPAPI